MRLTNYFIKKKVQSLASGAAGRKHEFCALEDAGHILVLYQANDRELVEPCLDVLRKKNKKVQACVYVTGDPEADASCIPVHAKKDVNVWQVPSDVVLERFKTVKADILIDLTRPDCYPMQYLTYHDAIVRELKSDEFEDFLAQQADSIGVSENSSLVKFYRPEKIDFDKAAQNAVS